jgi:glucosamine--fructose-6-phosphate aminotransferase (isomerizing)
MTGGNFRHGPVEVADRGFRAIVFAPSDSDESLNLALYRNIGSVGGRPRSLGPAGDWRYPPTPAALAPLVEIVPVQLATLKIAHLRGHVPGEFRFASQVTRSEVGFKGTWHHQRER